jgi:predicted lipoprotein with Yx(FWY)xxD motif
MMIMTKMIKTKRLPLYIAGGAGLSALAVLGLTLSQSGSSAAGVSASSSSTVVQTGASSFGQILVDAQGRTRYLFAKDTGPASTCVEACTSAWPPVPVSAAPHAAGGASASALGVIGPRSRRQLNYAGHPVYYLAGDSKAGQTYSQALNESALSGTS